LFRQDAYVVKPELPSGIGAEATGIISAVGSDVKNFNIGDRVTVLPVNPVVGTGTYAQFANIPQNALIHSLETSNDNEDSAFWCAYLTAYALLTEPKPADGSAVLITAASSSVGLALIQMAKDFGYTTIATTRKSNKKEELIEVGADHVVVTEEESLTERVNSITQGQGVALSLDAVAGKGLSEVIGVTRQGGEIKVYGALAESSMANARIDLSLFEVFAKKLSFCSVYQVIFDEQRFNDAQQYLRAAFKRKKLSPRINKVFALEDVHQAHQYLEQSNQVGKVLMSAK
jgi:NADPH:quinone reductase-like Zn-dependent oxidoreductase